MMMCVCPPLVTKCDKWTDGHQAKYGTRKDWCGAPTSSSISIKGGQPSDFISSQSSCPLNKALVLAKGVIKF